MKNAAPEHQCQLDRPEGWSFEDERRRRPVARTKALLAQGRSREKIGPPPARFAGLVHERLQGLARPELSLTVALRNLLASLIWQGMSCSQAARCGS
jgi:hypothetical protein